MTSLAPTRSTLPDDDSEEDYGARRRGRGGSYREPGRVWWRPNLRPRDDEQGELTLRERLVPSFAREPWWVSWGFPLLITLIGGVMRFRHLGWPKWIIFDETYYAKDAWATIHFGHEIGWHDDGPGVGMANDDKAIIANPHIWRTLVANHQGNAVHPPVGKWMIGGGEWLYGAVTGHYGFTPAGWRLAPAIVGTLAILMTARIARRMFRSTLIGSLAGLLLACDGLEFVMSRTSLLDIFVMFWTLASFGCLVVDRDKMRTRLVDWRESFGPGPLPDDVEAPKLGWRPWRIAAAICLGLTMGSKWSGIAMIFVFLPMSLLWDHAALRAVGIRRHWAAFFRRDSWQGISMGLLAGFTYMATWAGWFLTYDGNYRTWARDHHAATAWGWQALRSWWEYHWETMIFHTHLDSPHAYMSNPWSWLVMGRPTDYYYCSKDATGCPPLAADQHQQVLALGTPPLWWFATLALIWCCWRWIARRDWRAGAILAGMVAAWGFWLNYQHRTIFTFYAVAFVPFMCIAAAYLLGVIVGRADALQYRRVWGAVVAGAITVYILVMFIYFFPILTGQTITYNQWLDRMWWPSWI